MTDALPRDPKQAERLAYARRERQQEDPIDPATRSSGRRWPSRFTDPIGMDANGEIQLVGHDKRLEPVLSEEQLDRACAVLLGLVCGDALGVPYEFGRPPSGDPEMLGGGLGNYAPGEGSDDSQMAMIIGAALMGGADLTTEDGMDDLALRFIGWAVQNPPDIGMQTQAVLREASERLDLGAGPEVSAEGVAQACRLAARAWHERTGRSAGNGALMRTAPVALSHLLDAQQGAATARQVARLTHYDEQAGATCVLVGEAIRRAVIDGSWEPASGIDLLAPSERDAAVGWVSAALAGSPSDFTDDGYTVRTLQGAMAAVHRSRRLPTAAERFRAAVGEAVRGGGDTDTVAAVTGAMAAALDGGAAIPDEWRTLIHVQVGDAFGVTNVRLDSGAIYRTARSASIVFA